MILRARLVAATIMAGLFIASVSACTGGGSAGKASGSTSTTGTSAPTTAPAPKYVALPGLDGTSLISRFKARLGTGATELRLTSDVPTGQQSVFLDSAKKLAGPGAFTVIVGVHDETTVYRVLCEDHRAALGTAPANVTMCADLPLPGADPARVRSWVAAHRSGGKGTTLTLGRAEYYFSFDAEHTMTLIVSYIGTAG